MILKIANTKLASIRVPNIETQGESLIVTLTLRSSFQSICWVKCVTQLDLKSVHYLMGVWRNPVIKAVNHFSWAWKLFDIYLNWFIILDLDQTSNTLLQCISVKYLFELIYYRWYRSNCKCANAIYICQSFKLSIRFLL